MVEQEPLPRTDAGQLCGEAAVELSGRVLGECLRLDVVDEFVALSVGGGARPRRPAESPFQLVEQPIERSRHG
jgi:hypothetical protein